MLCCIDSIGPVGANARVPADGERDLVDVRPSGLADGGDGVDGGDALRQKRVGGELAELAGPLVGGQDPLPQRQLTLGGGGLARPLRTRIAK